MKILNLLSFLVAVAAMYVVLTSPVKQAERLVAEEIVLIDETGKMVTLRATGIAFQDGKGKVSLIAPGSVAVGEGGRMRRISYGGTSVEVYED